MTETQLEMLRKFLQENILKHCGELSNRGEVSDDEDQILPRMLLEHALDHAGIKAIDSAAEDEKGEYQAYVTSLAEWVRDDILNGTITSQELAIRQLEESMNTDSWVMSEERSIQILRYSDRPTYSFWEHGLVKPKEWNGWDMGRVPFPFSQFAASSLLHDVQRAVEQDEAYKNLPPVNKDKKRGKPVP